MSRINMSFNELDKIIDKGEVDTLSLHVPLKNWLHHSTYLYNDVFNKIKSKSILVKKQFEKVDKETGDIQIIDDCYYNSKYTQHLPYNECEYASYTFSYRCITGYLTITLPHIFVQGRNEKTIINELKVAMNEYFDISFECLNTIDDYILLSRIDYKFDYRCHSLEEYYLIKQIINIAPTSIIRGYYNKDTLADDDTSYLTVYKSKSNARVELTIYNKDKEQLQKLNENKINNEQYENHKRVIRFEVKFKNAKLNQLKYKNGTDKKIDNYKERFTARKLGSGYLEKVFFTEPFYRVDVAKKLVNNSDETSKTKVKLCALLDSININGYSYTREHYDVNSAKKHNYSKFNRHIEKLRNLNINPLTFNTTWSNNQSTIYEQLCNFTLWENCLEEETIIC